MGIVLTFLWVNLWREGILLRCVTGSGEWEAFRVLLVSGRLCIRDYFE